MATIKKNTIFINILTLAGVLSVTACSTVRDTTDWIPGVDSNDEVKVQQQQEAQAVKEKEQQAYKDKVAFAPTVKVSRSASESDARISVEIGQKYVASGDIKRADIGIEVNAGIVTLTGNVSSNESAVSAISLAKSTAGVSRVISRLVIINVRTPADANNK